VAGGVRSAGAPGPLVTWTPSKVPPSLPPTGPLQTPPPLPPSPLLLLCRPALQGTGLTMSQACMMTARSAPAEGLCQKARGMTLLLRPLPLMLLLLRGGGRGPHRRCGL
jgi:hypothetical protein